MTFRAFDNLIGLAKLLRTLSELVCIDINGFVPVCGAADTLDSSANDYFDRCGESFCAGRALSGLAILGLLFGRIFSLSRNSRLGKAISFGSFLHAHDFWKHLAHL